MEWGVRIKKRGLLSAIVFGFMLMMVSDSAFSKGKNAHSSLDMRLYRLDCGKIDVSDLNVFSDTFAYVGQTKTLVSSCYVIKHNDTWMLWDAGLPLSVADDDAGVQRGVFTLRLKKTFPDALKPLGITPSDIDYFGLSHTHFDHTGAAPLLTDAVLLAQKAELAFLDQHPEAAQASFMTKRPLDGFLSRKGGVKILSGDYDVFGDGRVVILSVPGHTPGHQALLLDLPKKGRVLLSGDQWHFYENYASNGVPSFNYDRVQTLASSDRLRAIIKNTGAELIVQHDMRHVFKIPVAPNYLK